MRVKHVVAALVGGMLAFGSAAQADESFPSRPSRLIVPYTPGGNTDLLGRVIAQGLSQAWGQSVVVENKPGAAGTIGVEMVVKSKPDGYTTVLGSFGNILVARSLYKNLGYEPTKDLEPVALLATPPVVLVAHAGLPFNDVKGLIEYARRNPGKLNYGSSGNGSSNHLFGELFASMAGVKLTHVPYKGSGPSVSDTIAGLIQLNFAPFPLVREHIKSGKLKALAVTSAQRSPVLPDVPTVAEAGLPGYEAVGWFGLMAPAGTPKGILDRINRDVNQVLKSPAVRESLSSEGAEPAGGSVEDARRSIAEGERKWGKLVEKLNIQL
ncbi:MAG: tripartite tricarboxylate transporter substrate binding protein [Pigmentiphaga sp.]|uniref:Bug family tripartite tricarboxylate transporter substrate binding protein n=1 Tax=Pigmentiphaga sp. TaxID=1977564 RepID=UPI0029BF8DB8|nr:tripartite tricarboxylate transporter substrate binding protein [Pigmentiphaga sp.]MDX3905176.1 tripartite tricarboxylate transporter substrate binding protein [Pigmentiphaga sp.]